MRRKITRRNVTIGLAAGASLATTRAFATKPLPARVVVVGGGFGGATAARFLKRLSPGISVTLIEPNATYTACPFSNLVVAGLRDLSAQQFDYTALKTEGINIVQDMATDVDPDRRTVTISDNTKIPYDKLILSPGIDIRWNALPGYDQPAAKKMPHAWKAGAQTVLLYKQIEEMPDDGLVVMSVPAAPYRCPPGPYERASLIAHYLKTHKPAARLLVLDAKDNFSKKPLFTKAWQERYPDTLEWRGLSDDGTVRSVDAVSMKVATDFESLTPDVANIIPPQKAGVIAERAGVTDATGWCPINATSFESTLQPDIHIIGDATIAAPMPKSAFSANLQGKVCAHQIARLMAGLAPTTTVLANTCYSLAAPNNAFSVAGIYRNEDGVFTEDKNAGGISNLVPLQGERAREAELAHGWFETITTETFGR